MFYLIAVDPLSSTSHILEKTLSVDPAFTSTIDFMPVYCQHLQNIIKEGIGSMESEKPLEGFNIVVDAGERL